MTLAEELQDITDTVFEVAGAPVARPLWEIRDKVAQLENEAAKGVHTCHADCPRPMCVLTRERDALQADNEKLRDDIRAMVQKAAALQDKWSLVFDSYTVFTHCTEGTTQEHVSVVLDALVKAATRLQRSRSEQSE